MPQWRVSADGEALPPDTLVFDLDPGPPATIVECCEVALMLRAVLEDDGLTARPKTSGSKGMQLYTRWDGREEASAYAKRVAQRLEGASGAGAQRDDKESCGRARSSSTGARTTPPRPPWPPTPLRARAHPTVSAPLLWKEVEGCANPEDLVFTTSDVLARADEHGDLFTRA